MTLLEKAIEFAMKAHAGQLDRGGKPYIEHPLAVMRAVAPNPIAMVVAVLHDVVEDTPITLDDIKAAFGDYIAALVDRVTRRKDETYFEYIARAASHPISKAVKIADIEHNSDLSRLPAEQHAWARSMVKNRYAKALRILKSAPASA